MLPSFGVYPLPCFCSQMEMVAYGRHLLMDMRKAPVNALELPFVNGYNGHAKGETKITFTTIPSICFLLLLYVCFAFKKWVIPRIKINLIVKRIHINGRTISPHQKISFWTKFLLWWKKNLWRTRK